MSYKQFREKKIAFFNRPNCCIMLKKFFFFKRRSEQAEACFISTRGAMRGVIKVKTKRVMIVVIEMRS